MILRFLALRETYFSANSLHHQLVVRRCHLRLAASMFKSVSLTDHPFLSTIYTVNVPLYVKIIEFTNGQRDSVIALLLLREKRLADVVHDRSDSYHFSIEILDLND
jgi:hypothetical protein